MVSPEEIAWDRLVYQHGPICLGKQSALSHRNSIATLEPFPDAVEKLRSSTEQPLMMQQWMKSLIFLESLGIYDTFGKCGLDRFWDTSPRPQAKL
jgi:hypothetical protein